MSIEAQTNAALAAYLATLGVSVANPVDLATQALAKDAKENAEREAEAIAGLLGGAKAKITAAAVAKFDLEKQAAAKDKEANDTARAMAYLMQTGNKLPLQKNLGLPIRADLKDQAEIPEGWAPAAAA